MRSVLLATVVSLVALIVVGCGSGDASPTGSPTAPGPSAGASVAGAGGVDTFTMSGTAGKTSPDTELSGDYTLTMKVKGKSGCVWSVRLEGEPPLVESNASSGTTQTSVALTGLFPASYRLVVKSTKCGAWSVGLDRP